ncbi:sensor histidine kinase [Granulicella arctica]|uniref:sensor histidine kinase n=1 Tax=Granulicella arctica TaxID=940613 RepID=UPI0021DF4441|nr:sensor histidine kinase [Granulicella arctica]
MTIRLPSCLVMPRKMTHTLFWIWFFCTPLVLRASEPLRLTQLDHASWTIKDGAPLDIRALVQADDGTIWLTAGNGLYNFNGVTFTPFQFQQSDLQVPFSIFEDRMNDLWVGFGIRGIAQIRNHIVIRTYGEKDGFPAGTVKWIAQDPNGIITAVAGGQIVQLRAGKWENPTASLDLGSDVQNIFFDRSGTLWAATTTSIWKLPAGDHKWQKVEAAGGFDTFFAEGPDGSVWAQNQPVEPVQSFTRRIWKGDLVQMPDRIRTYGFQMAFDWGGLLWMGSPNKGLIRILPAQTAMKTEGHKEADDFTVEHYTSLDGLSNNTVTTIMQDHDGDLWVATAGGLDRFRRPNLVRFVDRPTDYGNVLAQCPNGELWLGVQESSAISMRDSVLTEHGPKREFYSAHCDASNVVWVTGHQGLWRYSDETYKVVPPPAGILPEFVRQLVGPGDHLLYVSLTRNGLWRYSDGLWTRIAVPNLPDITPTSLLMDGQGRLWTGYLDNRVAVLVGDQARVFSGDKAKPLGMIQVFLESPSGMFVGATNGLAVLRGDQLETLQTVDQVDVRGISGLLQSANGDLWLNGLRGIVHIAATELAEALKSPGYQMRSDLMSEAGIVGPSPQVLEVPSAIKDLHGMLWFSTTNSVVSLDPSAIKSSTEPPNVTGMAMTVDGQPLPSGSRIKPGYHTLRISYFGVHVSAPEKVTYKYQLAGADQTWQDVGRRTEAVYTGLRAGKYRFSVIASNGEGVWSKTNDSLQFTVLPSFYQMPTFVVSCVVLGIGLIWLAYGVRIRSLSTAIRTREVVRADERIRIARDLHDTLLQGVQGLALRFGAATKQLPSGSRVRESLEAALISADRLLEEARNRVSSLRAQILTQQELIEGLRFIADEHNEQNQTRFRIDVECSVAKVSPSVWGELFYIGREAITNALRHSDASEISVSLRCISRAVIFIVSDDGSGFDIAAYQGAPTNGHWGLHGMQERAEAMGATFKCVSKRNVGTEVTIVVPMRWNYLKGAF